MGVEIDTGTIFCHQSFLLLRAGLLFPFARSALLFVATYEELADGFGLEPLLISILVLATVISDQSVGFDRAGVHFRHFCCSRRNRIENGIAVAIVTCRALFF